MDTAAHAELAALVVAWHNRHPLARRITAAQVRGEGLVVLPYAPLGRASADDPAPPAAASGAPGGDTNDGTAAAAPDPAAQAAPRSALAARLATWWQHGKDSLRQRVTRRAAQPGKPALRAAFDEDFISPLRPSRIGRFGLRQGSATRPGPEDWPQRQVLPTSATEGRKIELRYLRTAAIEVGKQRRRVLVGVGPRSGVIGPRLWSRPRCGAAAGLLAMLLGGGGWWGGLLPGTHPTPLAAAAPAASASGVLQDLAAASASAGASAVKLAQASPAASTGSQAAEASASASASSPATVTAMAPAAVASVPATASAAASVSPAASASPSRGILPALSPELRRQARQESEALRAAQAASGAASAGAASDGKVYAVATPETRTRAGAQLRIVLMNAPTEAEAGRPRAEILQVGNGWRAVIWPYENRAEAERTREQLAARGIPAEVIGF